MSHLPLDMTVVEIAAPGMVFAPVLSVAPVCG